MDHLNEGGESLLQLEIMKCQRAFAMSANDEPEEFEDIQFFHRITPAALKIQNSDVYSSQPHPISNSSQDNENESDEIGFGESVGEYGDPQFFPGNSVGYLETILEETDEEDEESSSGRHWWTPDSDTDTDSVIRIDKSSINQSINNQQSSTLPTSSSSSNNQCLFYDFLLKTPSNNFRSSATSKPFEYEDLYLFDTLDLAFEETLNKPRRRTGFAFQNSALVDAPLDKIEQLTTNKVEEDSFEKNEKIIERYENENEPAEMNEEDFFCSSSSDDNSEELENSDSSSSDEDKKSSKILAEFSLGENVLSKNQHRRSFESPSKIRSFRSFDSLNSLGGTELLFSKGDTFPSFSYIKEVNEPSSSRSSSIEEKSQVSRKNSDEVSSENLSEDSGISDLAGVLHYDKIKPEAGFEPGKSEFALNPLIYSSEESSLLNSLPATSSILEKEEDTPLLPRSYLAQNENNIIAENERIPLSENESEKYDVSSDIMSSFTVENIDVLAKEEEKSENSCPQSEEEELLATTGEGFDLISTKSNIDESSNVFNCSESLVVSRPSATLSSPSSQFHTNNSPLLLNNNEDELVLNTLVKNNRLEEEGLGLSSQSDEQEEERSVKNIVLLDAKTEHEIEESRSLKLNSIFSTEDPNSVYSQNISSPQSSSSEREEGSVSPLILEQNNSEKELEKELLENKAGGNKEKEEFELYSTSKRNENFENNAKKAEFECSEIEVEEVKFECFKTWTCSSSSIYKNNSDSLREEGEEEETKSEDFLSPVPDILMEGVENNFVVGNSYGRTSPPILVHVGSVSGGESNLNSDKKTVHFSPVVSEISWRDSYGDGNYEEPYSSESSSDNQLSPNDDKKFVSDELPHLVQRSDSNSPIEKVYIHSQTLPESLKFDNILKSEKERLLALEPNEPLEPIAQNSPVLISMVPDLLSQIEISPLTSVSNNEPSTSKNLVQNYDNEPSQSYVSPQQIFPQKFVASSPSTKNGAKSKKSSFSIPLPKSPPKKVEKESKKEEKDNKEKKGGFFQRLSKIRLSGSKSSKQAKQKIHPKESNSELISPSPQEAENGTKVPKGPILKKSSGSPVVVLKSEEKSKDEHDECNEAFENILEEIAGLNTILQRQQNPTKTTVLSNKRSFAERKQFLSNPEIEIVHDKNTNENLSAKLYSFRDETSKNRDIISKSQPDFETIEGATRKNENISQNSLLEKSSDSVDSNASGRSLSSPERKNEREWYKLLKTAAEKYYNGKNKNGKLGIVETDLDTGASRELLDDEIVVHHEVLTNGSSNGNGSGAKARSLTNLTSGLKLSVAPQESIDIDIEESEERAKSLEFLLDENQKSASTPPENGLRGEMRQLSEHELRIQASLSKLTLPDWYSKHRPSTRSSSVGRERVSRETSVGSSGSGTSVGRELSLLKRNEYGSASGLAGGWAGLSAYRTPSLSSLSHSGRYTGSLNRSNFVRGRPTTMSATRCSRESLLSPSSTASQSPSYNERCSFTYGMPLSLTKYGGGRLSSTPGTSIGSSTPPTTPAPPDSLSLSSKKPYLGWRSQERLNASPGAPPLRLSAYLPPAERLAAQLLKTQLNTTPQSQSTISSQVLAHSKSSGRPNSIPMGERPPRAPPRSESKTTPLRPLPPPLSPIVSEVESPSLEESIREVSQAISHFVSTSSTPGSSIVNMGEDGERSGGESVEIVEAPPRAMPRSKSSGSGAKKQALWFESSFVGKKNERGGSGVASILKK